MVSVVQISIFAFQSRTKFSIKFSRFKPEFRNLCHARLLEYAKTGSFGLQYKSRPNA